MSAQDNVNPAELLAALAAEVEALRRGVRDLGKVPTQLHDLAGVVAALVDRLGPASTAAGGLPSWLELEGDFADAVGVLGELVAWLQAVYVRYPDAAAGLPECWLWHPDVVEELLWLRGAWLQAYRGEAASVALAGDWHDRLRPGVVRRIRAVAGTCSLEAHQPGGDQHRDAAPVPLAEAIHLLGDWWATDRRSCPPAPDAGHIAAAAALRTPRGRR
jgi:hypothetical protein